MLFTFLVSKNIFFSKICKHDYFSRVLLTQAENCVLERRFNALFHKMYSKHWRINKITILQSMNLTDVWSKGSNTDRKCKLNKVKLVDTKKYIVVSTSQPSPSLGNYLIFTLKTPRKKQQYPNLCAWESPWDYSSPNFV